MLRVFHGKFGQKKAVLSRNFPERHFFAGNVFALNYFTYKQHLKIHKGINHFKMFPIFILKSFKLTRKDNNLGRTCKTQQFSGETFLLLKPNILFWKVCVDSGFWYFLLNSNIVLLAKFCSNWDFFSRSWKTRQFWR